jgi:hypothetical protein
LSSHSGKECAKGRTWQGDDFQSPDKVIGMKKIEPKLSKGCIYKRIIKAK